MIDSSQKPNPRLPFVSLTNLTDYSQGEAVTSPEEIAEAAAEDGMGAVALTDTANLFGAIRFYDACGHAGIKPIIGYGAVVAPKGRLFKAPENRRGFRLHLLAQSEEGLVNILALSLAAWSEGYYFRPRIDLFLLRQHASGIVILSGGPAGEIAWLLSKNRESEARALALWLAQMFPGAFFLEIQDHGYEIGKAVNPQVITLGRDLNIPVVATNDTRYAVQADAAKLDSVLADMCQAALDDPHRFRMPTEEFFFKSAAEMAAIFSLYPEVISNSSEIADRCQPLSRSLLARVVAMEASLVADIRASWSDNTC